MAMACDLKRYIDWVILVLSGINEHCHLAVLFYLSTAFDGPG